MIGGVSEAGVRRLAHQVAALTSAGMTDDEVAAERARTNWHAIARAEQLPPEAWRAGEKANWLILAGRGFGKTRTGAETVRWLARSVNFVNLIGATAADARDIMIEGESGILAVCPKWERPEYSPSTRKLLWPNGARSLIFSADEPERLRGVQHAALWCDEIASWRYPDTWTQAQFGLRIGKKPRTIITTTPRPTKLMKRLVADTSTCVTRGTTYDNRANLAPAFFDQIIRQYEGTRMGRQELNAEILVDVVGALWRRDQIDALRVAVAPAMSRVVIAVDPSVTANADSDECGIVGAGLGVDGHGYVLTDRTLLASPDGWARASVQAYHQLEADRVVAEVNNGGDLVEAVLRQVDANVSYKKVFASRGKMIRAEPIAALYEQGRIHHVGPFEKLEDELCDYSPASGARSPNRLDALVWAFTELFGVDGGGILDFYRTQFEAQQAQSGAPTGPGATPAGAPA